MRYKKIKIDKTKLLSMLATKRSIFDNLHKKMEKIPETLEPGESVCLVYLFTYTSYYIHSFEALCNII